MFWGLILKANKKYTQTLEKPFHLTCAALDYSNADDDPVQVMYSDGQASYLLCTLQKNKDMQFKLDLTFNEGDKLCFSTKGNGIVHLSGYLIPEEDFNYDPMMDDEDDEISEASEEETEVPDLREKLLSKKKEKEKAGKKEKAKKKAPVEEESSDEELSDDAAQNGNKSLDSSNAADEEESDDDDDEDLEDEEEDDDDESLDGEEESGEEDESDEEEIMPPKKQAKLDPKAQQKNGLENGQQKKDKKEKQKEQKKPEQAQTNAVKKLQGGLLVQDLKPGNGAEAKPGKKIQVYYEGRLKTNNKVFDSTKSGPGFKLTLGRGEVIKAWDIGLAGMKVGGKRRLTCPPGLAYGPRGNPPVIPANSTLVFDVELKNVL